MSSANAKSNSVFRMKRFWFGLLCVVVIGLLSSCSGTRVLMQTTPSKPKNIAASPAITTSDLFQWKTEKADIRQILETEVYGKYPDSLTIDPTQTHPVNGQYFGGKSRIEIETLTLSNPENDQSRDFKLIVVYPIEATSSAPVIIMQSFCPSNDVIPEADMRPPPGITFSCSGNGMMDKVFGYFFGRYIRTPPIEMILDHGYAFAVMYPPEFIPDSAGAGLAAIDSFFSDQEPANRTHAIAAWSKQFSLVANHLKSKPEFSAAITYGHSRYGKTALVAAAYDSNIDAVISHQSGTGGASLSRNKPGETVADITSGYPHWFTKNYKEINLTLDQHHLLALIAPRPVLLGNAKRDVWSDPEGGFRAAQGATPVYQLYGSDGLRQSKLTNFDPFADLSFWIRPGTHGVVKEDWPAFLEFLDAHFK